MVNRVIYRVIIRGGNSELDAQEISLKKIALRELLAILQQQLAQFRKNLRSDQLYGSVGAQQHLHFAHRYVPSTHHEHTLVFEAKKDRQIIHTIRIAECA